MITEIHFIPSSTEGGHYSINQEKTKTEIFFFSFTLHTQIIKRERSPPQTLYYEAYLI